MSAATQIASREFDADFFRLPSNIQSLVQKKIDDMGLRLAAFQHYRLTGADRYRLRVGDYRVIYHFDPLRLEIYLIAMAIAAKYIAAKYPF